MDCETALHRNKLCSFQNDDLRTVVRACERLLHGCPVMDDKVPHRLLYGFRPLLVDKTIRQEQDGIVSRPLYFNQPVEERDAFRRHERRIGDDIFTTKIYLMKLHPQRSSFGIEAFVKIDQLRIGI